MFEKEAEEYANRYVSEGVDELKIKVIKGHWQSGAEFGYNKANEWHYVKDGNPNNENDILCQISKDEVVVGYYHIKKKRYITIDGQDLYNVIAWKEIVLPKKDDIEMNTEVENICCNCGYYKHITSGKEPCKSRDNRNNYQDKSTPCYYSRKGKNNYQYSSMGIVDPENYDYISVRQYHERYEDTE